MRRVAAFALVALASGCTLDSDKPLIKPVVAPAELTTGSYRIYLPLLERDAEKLGDARVRECLKEVRSVEGSDTPDGPRRTERIVYCERDPNTGNGPYTVELRGTRGVYSLKGPEGVGSVAFKPLGDGRYLTQTQKAPSLPGYDYMIAGFHGDDIDVYALGCSDFPSVTRKEKGAELNPVRCKITALSQITSELAKVVAQIEAETKAPLVIFKRLR